MNPNGGNKGRLGLSDLGFDPIDLRREAWTSARTEKQRPLTKMCFCDFCGKLQFFELFEKLCHNYLFV